jgi:uncharacterized protein DUF1318
MKKRIARWLAAGVCGLLAACAIITVNVYFPEKDVKQAYKSLDEMLLKQGGEGAKGTNGQKPEAPAEQKEEVKPQSLLRVPLRLSLVGEAWAAETVADDLAVELSSLPEVLKAYDEMKARLPELNALRDSGAVGETNQGLVSIRDKAKGAGKEGLVKAENDNRKVVITGMAKAILKINKQPVSEAAIKQVLGKAAATYADTRREAAKPGWWIQLQNGRWVQK